MTEKFPENNNSQVEAEKEKHEAEAKRERFNRLWRDANFKVVMQGEELTLPECYDRVIARSREIFKETQAVAGKEIPVGKYILYVNSTKTGVMDSPDLKYFDEDRRDKVYEAETGDREATTTFQADNMRRCLGLEKGDDRFMPFDVYDDEFPKDLSDCVGIVLSGSEIDVKDETDEKRKKATEKIRHLIRRSKDLGIPKLGICFGGQLLASEEGAEVDWIKDEKDDRKTVFGAMPIKIKEGSDLLKDLPGKIFAAQSHGQEVVKETLNEETILAESESGAPEIIYFENTDTLCLQFHLEAGPSRLELALARKGGEDEARATFKEDTMKAREVIFPVFLRQAGAFAKKKENI